MNPKKVVILGMELEEWKFKSCTAHFGVESDWATLYNIKSSVQGRGHATELLARAKTYYESKNKRVGGSVALNSKMRRIYKKLGYEEYK